MVLINKAINEVTVKLVYYGPGLCGKTTNLEKIYGNPKLENKGKMISMSTETDRTLFFDFMPMELGTIAGQKVRVQLYTVPGQVFYDATRKLVLRGADGVVFVADSQNSMRGSNIESLENLKTNLRLNRLDPKKVAIVFQFNKRDLPNVDSVEEMNEYMNPDRVPFVEAAARDGIGVTATLRAAVAKILDNVKNNVDTTLYEAPELTAPDMSAKSGVAQHSAGTPKLSMRTEAVSAPAPAPPPPPAPMAVSPFESAFHATAVEEEPEEDPFGAFAVVAEPEEEADDPFAASATAVHDTSAERDEMNALLASARSVVESLERALEAARKHEEEISARLSSRA
ncbi:MAG: mutual gliding-motility protein MglA [Acidobacteriota bacterium]|jgi:signal recognition particle receptor subunit beta|nr:mutual gliding-motility protein MglA [Acidobacteriota bacterium]